MSLITECLEKTKNILTIHLPTTEDRYPTAPTDRELLIRILLNQIAIMKALEEPE